MSSRVIIAIFLVLCCISCPSFSTQTTGWAGLPSGANQIIFANLSYGDLFVDSTPEYKTGEGEVTGLTYKNSEVAELTSHSYTGLMGAILAKIYSDVQKPFSPLWKISLERLESFTKSGIELSHTLIESCLWTVVTIWLAAYSMIARLGWLLITNFTLPVLALAILCLLTTVICRALIWLYSQLPMFLLTFPWAMIRLVTKLRFRRSKVTKEKACEGYTTFSIPQTPPKNSVVEITHSDGSHSGYATCVKLHNGHNGLLTAYHVVSHEEMAVHSLRNGAKIKLDAFKPFFENEILDISLFQGPPSWESTLACSSVNMVCANSLALCEARLFGFDGKQWKSRNAKIIGSFEKQASVLSNTDKGDSGSAYFHGKNVIGVHSGFPTDGENFNLMSPIPNIPGLTSSKLVFETTAPQGRVFDDETLNYFAELCEEFSIGEARSIMQNRKGKSFEGKSQNQGNEQRCTDSATNGAPNIQKTKRVNTTPPPVMEVPVQSQTPPTQEDMMGKILEALLNRINVADIETKIVEKVAKQVAEKHNKSRGTRGGKKMSEASENTSKVSTTGKYRPPHSRSPGSVTSEQPPSITTPNKRRNQNGGGNSRSSTQNWQRKQPVSGGPSSGLKQS
nr:P1 [Wild carrot red leaf virus]